MVLAEGELHLAHLRDALRVGHRVRIPGEQCLHLLRGAQIEVLRFIPHPVLVVHGLACLDAQQHVVALGVLLAQIVGVVGAHHGNARLVVQPQDAPVHLCLLPDAVILQFQIEIALPEDILHGQRVLLRALIVPVHQPPGDLARQTRRQRDQPLRMLPQQVKVDAGLDVKALAERLRHHVRQIPVARLVLAQQHQMPRLRVELMLLVEPRPPRHIHLAPDDGMDPLGFAGAVKVHRAVHNAVVCDGAGRLPHLLYLLRQVAYPARAVQQAVFRMHMQMHKSHTRSPVPAVPSHTLPVPAVGADDSVRPSA